VNANDSKAGAVFVDGAADFVDRVSLDNRKIRPVFVGEFRNSFKVDSARNGGKVRRERRCGFVSQLTAGGTFRKADLCSMTFAADFVNASRRQRVTGGKRRSHLRDVGR
jgi:hypothetical protein